MERDAVLKQRFDPTLQNKLDLDSKLKNGSGYNDSISKDPQETAEYWKEMQY